MKKLLLYIAITTSLFSEDVMVQRMQSIVDEVTQLRSAYETSEKKVQGCEEKLLEQEAVVQKLSRSQGMDYKDFEKNRAALKQLQGENKTLKNYKRERDTLEKENHRLRSSARILVDKNQALLKQVNKYKQSQSVEQESLELELKTTLELLAVKEAENRKLEKELRSIKTTKKAKTSKPCPVCKECKQTKCVQLLKNCEDKNPFPRLMPKDGKIVHPHPVELEKLVKVKKVPSSKKEVIVKAVKNRAIVEKKASSYRIKNETAVYDSIDGNIVAVWEAKTSFTSNVRQGDWVQITGFFVNKRWQRAKKTLWVKSKDTIKR